MSPMVVFIIVTVVFYMFLGAVAIATQKPTPEPWNLQFRETKVTRDRPVPQEYWRGKTIEEICRELSEGIR